jgi:hypothetical protein
MLKRILNIIGLVSILALASISWGQSTTVSVTVQDPTGQLWINGTFSYTFAPVANFSGPSQWQGANVPTNFLTPTTVTLDGGGSTSFSIPSNTAITPAGSTWRFTVCPRATIQCVTINLPITGATLDISSAINGALVAIKTPSTTMPLAYQSSEVQTVVRAGGLFYDTTTNQPMFFDGTAWHPFNDAGCISDCIISDPTGNQLITQPGGTALTINFLNSSVLNVTDEYRFNGGGAVDHILLGNGTGYVDSATFPYSSLSGAPTIPVPFSGTGIPSATSDTTSTPATSAQIVGQLNTSPSTILVPTLLPKATASSFGVVEPDNSTITESGGVISAIQPAIPQTRDLIITSGICTTAATAYAQCSFPSSSLITWSSPFADTNYTITCTGSDPTTTGISDPVVTQLFWINKQVSGFQLTIQNGSENGANAVTFTEIDCHGSHL